MNPMDAVMKLERELCYRALPIIGKLVVIESLDDVDHVLRQLAAPWLDRDPVWSGADAPASLAKYGLLDRWCDVDRRHLEGGLRGLEALRATGFASTPEFSEHERAFAVDATVDLAESVGPCLLKLFLNDHFSDDLRSRHYHEALRAGRTPDLIPDYFPRSFVVTDACVTNASLVWFEKHFYL